MIEYIFHYTNYSKVTVQGIFTSRT